MRGSVLDSGCRKRLLARDLKSVPEAFVVFSAVSKAPEDWRSPRPGGHPTSERGFERLGGRIASGLRSNLEWDRGSTSP